jgi:hypothetical protein
VQPLPHLPGFASRPREEFEQTSPPETLAYCERQADRHPMAMKNNHPTHLLCAAGFLLAASLLYAAPLAIFTGATLIDGSGQLPVEHAVLVIQEGRVVAAG